MKSIFAWLQTEVLQIRGWHIRRLHGAALVAVVLGALAAAGVFAGSHLLYRTLPAPKLPPGQTAPRCPGQTQVGPRSDHSLGGCLPRPRITNSASITATNQGPDLSNNDPVYGDANWAKIAAKNSFVIFKVNESTGYVDPTAAPMTRYAKAHGLTVGGYDFLHVCLVSPTAEADVFVYHLNADGLTGPNTLPGTGDAEYPSSTSCNTRTWIFNWAWEVKRLTGRWPMFYTGAWWWQPHVGAYWPNPSLAWISGYGVRYPYLPSGRSQLDIWQFADNGWNGVSAVDLSIWRDGPAAFTQLVGGTPVDRYRVFDRTRRNLGHGVVASERNTAVTWDQRHCSHPARRGVCVSSRNHARLLVQRIDRVSCHTAPAGFGVSGCDYRPANRRVRRYRLDRIAQP